MPALPVGIRPHAERGRAHRGTRRTACPAMSRGVHPSPCVPNRDRQSNGAQIMEQVQACRPPTAAPYLDEPTPRRQPNIHCRNRRDADETLPRPSRSRAPGTPAAVETSVAHLRGRSRRIPSLHMPNELRQTNGWWRRLGRRWPVLRGCARTRPAHQRHRRTVQPIPAQLPRPVADVGQAWHRGLVALDTESSTPRPAGMCPMARCGFDRSLPVE